MGKGGRRWQSGRSRCQGGRKWNAVLGDLVEICEHVVAQAGSVEAGWRKTWSRGGKKTNRVQAKVNPTARMDGIVAQGRRSWAHVKLPRVAAPLESSFGESDTTVKVGR